MTNVDSQRIKEIRDNTRAMAEAFGRIADTLAEALELYVSTQTETKNSNLTFEKEDELQIEACPFDDPIPCEWVCTEWNHCKYKPKTEPQREYPTEWCENCELWREDNCMGVAQCKRNIQILTEAYKQTSNSSEKPNNVSEIPTSSDPQTEMPRCSVNGTPFDECGFCEYFNCDTCKCEADVPQTE